MDKYERNCDRDSEIIIQEANNMILIKPEQNFNMSREIFRLDQIETTNLNNLRDKNKGKVTCTAIFGQYYFLGNGLGQIKVIDLTD